MSDRDEDKGGSRHRSRRVVLWLASGVGVTLVVVAGVAVFANSGDETSGDDPAAPTTSVDQADAPDPLPTNPAEEEAEPEPVVDPWESIPILFYSGPEGVYRTGTGFFAQFQVALPEGWMRAFPELPDIVELSPSAEACETDQTSAACVGLITVVDSGGPSVEETTTAIRTVAGVSSSEPVPAEVGDATGVRFQMWTDEPSATVATLGDGGRVVMSRTRIFQAYVLDVDGRAVTLFVDSPAESPMNETALPVLNSIAWRDLN